MVNLSNRRKVRYFTVAELNEQSVEINGLAYLDKTAFNDNEREVLRVPVVIISSKETGIYTPNNVAIDRLTAALGDETDDWQGAKFVLRLEQVKYKNVTRLVLVPTQITKLTQQQKINTTVSSPAPTPTSTSTPTSTPASTPAQQGLVEDLAEFLLEQCSDEGMSINEITQITSCTMSQLRAAIALLRLEHKADAKIRDGKVYVTKYK
ncbi:MAG: hypothetical protein QXW26_04735 [Candidatus Nitrosocaldus sp.]